MDSSRGTRYQIEYKFGELSLQTQFTGKPEGPAINIITIAMLKVLPLHIYFYICFGEELCLT